MKRKIIIITVIVISILGMLCIYPFGVIKKNSESIAKAAKYYDSGFIKDDIVYTQSFLPKENFITSISIQLNRDNTFQKGHEGMVTFTLTDENDNIIFQTVEQTNNVKSKDYFEFSVNKKVNKGDIYFYTIKVEDCESEGPTVRFGEYTDIGLTENQILYYAGNEFPQYSTVAIYRYKGDLSILDIFIYASLFLFLITFVSLDVVKIDQNTLLSIIKERKPV